MSTVKSVAVGVELAGRGTTVALVDRRGNILHRLHARTLKGRPALATLEPSLRTIENMLSYAHAAGYKVRGLGICLPGSLDTERRRPLLIPALPSFK